MDTILVVPYGDKTINTWRLFLQATSYEAFVYTCTDKTSEWLENKCKQLNDTDHKSVWTWDNEPVPVLIQHEK